jgi:hypothetical protein
MDTFRAARAALAAALDTTANVTVYPKAPGAVNIPAGGAAAVVMPATGQFLTFGSSVGSDDLAFRVLVLVASADDPLAQDTLDDYLDGSGATAVKAAVEADPTLGGTVDYAVVEGVGDYGRHEFGGTSYWGAAFTVTCGVS